MIEGKWFAVYTRPRWEKRVADLLTKKKIENYCPVNKIDRPWTDRKKTISEPLFTSYVFARLTPQDYVTVMQASGFQSFVYWLGEPAVIRKEEIDAIRLFMNQYPVVRIEKTQVNHSEEVRIISDPVILRKGNVLEVRNNIVKVVLPSLGHALIADMNKENVENIKYGQPSLLSA